MKTKKIIIVLAFLTVMGGLAGCQSSKQSQTVQPGQQVTLSGLMQQGTLSAMNLASYGNSLHPAGTALANYKLYCVTFEDTPSAATGTADNAGHFSLTIKSYTPFGCFVLDANNQHVADLLFAGLGSTSGTYSGSIMLTNNANVGTITVDPNTGMAVVNVAGVGGVAGNNITGTAFDPTGTWTFTCTSPAGDPVYSCPTNPADVPSSLYLDRISGIMSSDGQEHYGMGVWMSQANYLTCGSVEGLCSSPGCMTAQGPVTGTTVALARPDGPFLFAYDNVWQPALDSLALNSFSVCGSSAATCGGITANTQGWMIPGTSTPYSPGQCQQMCYANDFYNNNIKDTSSYCLEDRNYLWDQTAMQNVPGTAPTNDNSTPFMDFGNHNPTSRLMFGELVYSSDTSASEVSTDYWVESLWDQSSQTSYTCYINEVTKLSVSQLAANTLTGTVDQYRTLSGSSSTMCTSTAINPNYVLQDLNSPMHMMFKMTK